MDDLGIYPDRATAIRVIVAKIGCSRESLRRWVVQAETDSGTRAGVTSVELAWIRGLERKVGEVRPVNKILTE